MWSTRECQLWTFWLQIEIDWREKSFVIPIFFVLEKQAQYSQALLMINGCQRITIYNSIGAGKRSHRMLLHKLLCMKSLSQQQSSLLSEKNDMKFPEDNAILTFLCWTKREWRFCYEKFTFSHRHQLNISLCSALSTPNLGRRNSAEIQWKLCKKFKQNSTIFQGLPFISQWLSLKVFTDTRVASQNGARWLKLSDWKLNAGNQSLLLLLMKLI